MTVRIYTRTGDAGKTSLWGGVRVPKNSARVEAYGTVDELNAFIGAARVQCQDSEIDALLGSIQHHLFAVGADLSAPGAGADSRGGISVTRVGPEMAAGLEAHIDSFEAELPPLTRFILPGGTPLSAALHVARAVARRAERNCVTLAEQDADEGVNGEVIVYLNRLSDLLFVLARAANHRAGASDVIWNG